MSTNQASCRNMGIGTLGERGIVFARKFRFTLAGSALPEFAVSTVKVDFAKKLLHIQAHDLQGVDRPFAGLVWGLALAREPAQGDLSLTTYDGCGRSLYTLRFSGFSLAEHQCDFDYAVSDVSTQNLSVNFTTCELEIHPLTPLDERWAPISPDDSV